MKREEAMAIKALEQEPKIGHWFIKNERYYKCTKCGAEYDTWYHELKYRNYCPNCGCAMVEQKKSEGGKE